ncbi:MAG: formimidoylglutamate deiminase [Myxococcales bacterium]|nr:formimidoylglutamate deiminase [Myxococcales bacterium]
MMPALTALQPNFVFHDGRFGPGVVHLDGHGRIVSVDAAPLPGAARVQLRNMALLPGFINAHSHVFQRLLRGVAERPTGRAEDFWSWRTAMYALVDRMTPELLEDIATATYLEMRQAGYTRVKEFHYLHHLPVGRRYADPHELTRRLIAAARTAGIALELMRVVYLDATEPSQRRFQDASIDEAITLTDELHRTAGIPVGIAPHSVRAVSPDGFRRCAEWARLRGAELHAHVAEQPKEVAWCMDRHGRTPVALLAEAGALGPRTHAVHLTHLNDADVTLIGQSGTVAVICPSTEANLADGIPRLPELLSAGAGLAIGSDSQAHIDPFLELRSLEYHERLRSGRRCHLGPGELLTATTVRQNPGDLADFLLIDLDSPSLAGVPLPSLDAALAFGADARVIAGHWHALGPRPVTLRPDLLRAAARTVWV